MFPNEDIGLLIVNNHLPMQFVESLWMKCLCLHLNVQDWFFLPKNNFHKRCSLGKKKKQLYALLVLAKCNFAIENVDLWMSKGMHDTLTFVINFLGVNS
jgi:hypothetical protein